MGMRDKYRKPTTFRCNAGSRCSMSAVVWSLVGFLLFLHLYSLFSHNGGKDGEIQFHSSHHPLIRELEQVEEDNIQIPPPRGKRSPRAAKRRPKRTTTLIDEFLDENSQLRHVFFPGMKSAIDPMNDAGNNSFYYYPGRIWLDTEGNPIQAHGGGILYDEMSKTYYWYGEYKDGPTYHAHKKGAARPFKYGSAHLVGFFNHVTGAGGSNVNPLLSILIPKLALLMITLGDQGPSGGFSNPVPVVGQGKVYIDEKGSLSAEETNETHALHKSNVLERPKVIYNDRTGKYVMWMHIDDANYTKAAVEDYLDVHNVVRRILVGQHREAPALFKHQGTYYMITSGCTGWAPNEALAHAAESVMGPWELWEIHALEATRCFGLQHFLRKAHL
ncbi:hypothetical protein GH714_015735 [Hevea brasiliensis]|uniref:Uncharacterized protein n=1 Tax=Hevea brasiliensis TaxID=3981 RepID=A0A6A6L3J6_HEVBR|nr:hypothetical protein GH714_015735 [Hevea brasiliensis]